MGASLRDRAGGLRPEPLAASQPIGAHPLRGADPSEPAPYGIGSDHWPGVGKALEEMSELGTVLGKLFGSGGARHHWSGDLVRMMQDEIADVRAALAFLEEANPVLGGIGGGHPEHGFHLTDGCEYISRREQWKKDLFRSWQRRDTAEDWPQPESYGLPPRDSRSKPDRAETRRGSVHESDGAEGNRPNTSGQPT